jgi:hypothetical protein
MKAVWLASALRTYLLVAPELLVGRLRAQTRGVEDLRQQQPNNRECMYTCHQRRTSWRA